MALSVPDYPDPRDAPGETFPAAYAWIGEVSVAYGTGTGRVTAWIHKSAGAAATWPGGARVEPVERLPIRLGGEVPGLPGVVFPTLPEVMARAADIGATMYDAASTPEDQSAVLAAISTGAAIRGALYAYLEELVFPGATTVD